MEQINQKSPLYAMFNPLAHEAGEVLTAFERYVKAYRYAYNALNRSPPASATTEEARKEWRAKDKARTFLGHYAHRNLQERLEDVVEEERLDEITFDELMETVKTQYRLNTNDTLMHYKFKCLVQQPGESFDMFAIRTKRLAQSCKFKCASENCDVWKVLVRDQLLFGTTNKSLREKALSEQWNFDDLIRQGKTIEAASRGAESIKIKQEPGGSGINRASTSGKYSKKTRNKEKATPDGKRCKNCSSAKCVDPKKCPAKNITCFNCGKTGHYKNSEACRTKKSKKSARKVDTTSDTSSESESEESSKDEEPAKTLRVKIYIPANRAVGG